MLDRTATEPRVPAARRHGSTLLGRRPTVDAARRRPRPGRPRRTATRRSRRLTPEDPGQRPPTLTPGTGRTRPSRRPERCRRRRLGAWTAHLRARERVRRHVRRPRASAGCRPTRSPATCSAGSSRGAASSNVFLRNGARLYLDVGSPPRVRDARVRRRPRARRARQGGGAHPRGPARRRRAAAARGGHRRRRLPVQEQHRLGRQLLRLPRELPGRPARRVRPAGRRADPVPRHPADHLRRRQGAADAAGRGVLPSSQRAEHIWEGVSSATTRSPADHQHPRRAARRRRALPPAARHRRRLEHERDDHAAQGRQHRPGAADDRGGRRDARPDAGEPDPRHPRDQPRHRPAGARCGWPTAARPARSTSRREYLEQGARTSSTAREPDADVASRSLDLWERALRRSRPATSAWSTARSTG